MMSKRERMALIKEDPLFEQRTYNVVEGLEELFEPTNQLRFLIQKIRNTTNSNHLDITHGSMASQTADACYSTLMPGLKYIKDYFDHIGHEELSRKTILRCLTTRLVECFFGHIATKAKEITCVF